MSEFKIEKDIPLPPRKSSSGRTAKYPWRWMEVGDSFLVPGLERASQFSGRAGKTARTLGIKIATRKVDGGVRVWRIK
jgi:hypothetical protein